MSFQYPWMKDQQQQQTTGIGPSNPQQQIQEQVPQPPQQLSREDWRDQWMSQGQMTPEQADQWLSSHGATQMQGGEKAGRWITPHGEALDLQIGRSGALANNGKITAGWTSFGGQPQQQSYAPQAYGGMKSGMNQAGIGPSWTSQRVGARPMQRRRPMSPYSMTQGLTSNQYRG